MIQGKEEKEKVSFSNYKIKKSYVQCIKNEIKKYSEIGLLQLDGNKFGDEGVGIICRALLYTKVREIDLSNNQLSEKSLEILVDLVTKNRNIKKVAFKENQISQQQGEEFQSKFKALGSELLL